MIGPTSTIRGLRLGRNGLHAGLRALAIFACAGFGASGCSRDPKASAANPSQPTQPPSFLVYVSDTLRADALKCYGNEVIDTPNLDALAAKGVLFEHAIAPSPWTRASMASILTGLYPSAHLADARMSVLPDIPRMSDYLKKHGYQTGNFTTNPNTAAVYGFQSGFDHFDEFGEARRRANRVRASELSVPSDKLHESIVSWLSGLDPKKPFFVYALAIDPHAPYVPPPEFDRYGDPAYDGPIRPGADEKMLNRQELSDADKARVVSLYHGDVAYNDHTLGDLLAELKKLGRADNTVVVFTADHGEEFWEHGDRGHGKALFTESLRVPLIWYDPHQSPTGQRMSRVVSTIDIMPTILERAQIQRPNWLQGAPLFSETAADRPVFAELNLDGRHLSAVHLYPWKLILNQESERPYLFNMESDPGEKRNLASKEPEHYQRLRKILDQHIEESPKLGKTLASARIDLDQSELPEGMESELKALGYLGEDEDEDEAPPPVDDGHGHADTGAEDEEDTGNRDDGVEDVPADAAGVNPAAASTTPTNSSQESDNG